MSLIRKSTELVIPTTVKMMIYGQSGMGKSTLALSSPNPLLLDFDGGVKRINLNHLENVDSVQVEKWEDMKELLSDVKSLSPYLSIVVDTVGKMMDYIITYKCGTRQPRIQDWGGINQEFQWFTRSLSSLNKNIVFVAHRDTRKEGDDTVFIPSIREKTYSSIVTELDLLGYLEMKSENGRQKRTVTFDPTSRNDGKNTCSLPSVMDIPTILDAKGNAIGKNDFIQSKVIQPYIGMLKEKKHEQEEYEKVMTEIKEQIELITDDISANDFVGRIDSFTHVGSSKVAAAHLLNEKTKFLGLVYDKKSKAYVKA